MSQHPKNSLHKYSEIRVDPMMTRDQAIALALELVREEMDDPVCPTRMAESAVGRIFRELSRLPADQDDSEELLEGFVRIAAAATEIIAMLAVKEGASGC